jgi:hypothetical protein
MVHKLKWEPVILAHGHTKDGHVFVTIPATEAKRAAVDDMFLHLVP